MWVAGVLLCIGLINVTHAHSVFVTEVTSLGEDGTTQIISTTTSSGVDADAMSTPISSEKDNNSPIVDDSIITEASGSDEAIAEPTMPEGSSHSSIVEDNIPTMPEAGSNSSIIDVIKNNNEPVVPGGSLKPSIVDEGVSDEINNSFVIDSYEDSTETAVPGRNYNSSTNEDSMPTVPEKNNHTSIPDVGEDSTKPIVPGGSYIASTDENGTYTVAEGGSTTQKISTTTSNGLDADAISTPITSEKNNISPIVDVSTITEDSGSGEDITEPTVPKLSSHSSIVGDNIPTMPAEGRNASVTDVIKDNTAPIVPGGNNNSSTDKDNIPIVSKEIGNSTITNERKNKHEEDGRPKDSSSSKDAGRTTTSEAPNNSSATDDSINGSAQASVPDSLPNAGSKSTICWLTQLLFLTLALGAIN